MRTPGCQTWLAVRRSFGRAILKWAHRWAGDPQADWPLTGPPAGADAAWVALQRLSRQHARVLDTAADGIYEIDRNGRTRFVNPAAARLLGWPSHELIGHPVHEVLHGSVSVDEAICPIHAALVDGVQSHVKDDEFRTRAGARVPVEYACTPIIEETQIIGAVITFQSVAERRTIEAEIVRVRDWALDIIRQQATTNGTLRASLAEIVGLTELLLASHLSTVQHHAAAVIKARADTALARVNQIPTTSLGATALDDLVSAARRDPIGITARGSPKA